MTPTWKQVPKKKKGVLCGADASQEWLLPWWWSRYSEFNRYPVTFCDFGLTEEMREWCRERGELVRIELNPSSIAPRSTVDEELAKQWEKEYGWRVWNARQQWFKKPFAFLESSYETAIWIDLDCEVLASLSPLFKKFHPPSGLALVRDYHSDPFNIRYNGGVVVFAHGTEGIKEWAKGAVTKNHLFGGDDSLLSHLIYSHQLEVQELPEIYNWRMARGLNLNAVIVHWVGNGGKSYIRTHGGLKPSLDSFFHSIKGKF